MIGARVSSRRPSPTRALVILATSAVLAGLGVATGAGVLVPIAVLPFAIGASLLILGERAFAARFTPAGMEIASPRYTVEYASLLEVRPLAPAGQPRPDAFPIQVVHAGGTLVIPARLSLSSERVYAFLRGFLVDRRAALPFVLEAYRAEQEGSFGREKVWSYVGRRGGDLARVRSLRAIALGFLVTAWVWAGIPFRRTGEAGWWVAAALVAIVGGIVFIYDLDIQRRQTSGAGAAAAVALVITPLGLAVQQGALAGHLAWQEIRRVTVRARSGSFVSSGAQTQAGIVLEVEGATIVLTDSYDRPLSEIHDRIQRYWRGPEGT